MELCSVISIAPMLLRCTGRLLTTISGKSKASLDTRAPASGNDFYANLIWIDGRKCLLVTHAGSLFSIFAADVRVGDLRPIGKYVVPMIEEALRSEGLPTDTFGHLDAADVELAKTASRSVLGCMNDLALHCEFAVLDAGGVLLLDVGRLNHDIRRTILGPLGSSCPIEVVAQLAATNSGPCSQPLLRLVHEHEQR